MKHDQKVVLQALNFLDTFSENQEYKGSLTIIYDYIMDLANLISQYQEQIDKNTDTLMKIIGVQNNREGRRKLEKMISKVKEKD